MKTLKYFIFLTVTIITAVSCENFLDPEPDGRKSEELVFNNYTYALGFFADIYNQLPYGFHNTGGAMEDCATDDAEHSDQLSVVQDYNNGSWNQLNFPDAYLYGKYYSSLRKLAIFMDNVDKARFIDPNMFNRSPQINKVYQERFKGESFFLRAFFYFELVKRFGGVPIVPERRLTLDDNLNLPRSTFDECVEYIVKNCDSAINRLPVKDTVSTWIGHATKASAYGLKSRILLYAASPLHNPTNDIERWKTSAAAAKEAIDILSINGYGLYTADPSVKEKLYPIWNEFYNKEVLFAMPYSNNNDFEYNNFPIGFENGRGLTNPTQDLVDAFEMSNGKLTTDPTSGYNPTLPYYRRDPRLAMVIGYNGQTYNNRAIETYIGGLDGLNKDQSATKTGYYIKKYINLNANLVENTGQARLSWVHFRYAELLLNYAEAMNEAYGPEVLPSGYTLTAMQAINQVRSRAGLSVLATGLAQDIFRTRLQNERRVELCFEGHRAWDIRRWKMGEIFNQPIHGMRVTNTGGTTLIFEKFEVEQRSFDVTKMYLMPIPQSEIAKSGGVLEQNPNW
jgi:starch-binding outer membrane protein, SusD/RagB family